MFLLAERLSHCPQALNYTFGLDKVRNAIHCTDLAEDAILEVK